MKLRDLGVISCGFTILATTVAAQTAPNEHPIIRRSSQAFETDADAVSRFLVRKGFPGGLASPRQPGISSDALESRKKTIQAAAPISSLARGAPNVAYDVVLQPGHYGRTTGDTATRGRRLSEQQLTAYVVGLVAGRLRDQGVNVLVVGADDFVRDDPKTPEYDGLSARLFLSIHAYGAAKRCTAGPSLVYAPKSSTYVMHALGWGLAQGRGYSYADLRKYGFPVAPAGYYMFDQMRASEFSGLLDLGDLTCPTSEIKLTKNAQFIAADLAHAIKFVLTVPYDPA